jgi:peptidoglycan/xylan/chitin deacetylase (PgdA/CDA1 family)
MGFAKNLKGWTAENRSAVPVLMFHKIDNLPTQTATSWSYVSPEKFREMLGAAIRAEFRAISIEEAPQARHTGTPRFVITFDDGYECVFKNAADCLREYGVNAIQYLVADRIGWSNDWDLGLDRALERTMDLTQVREWLSMGHEIGAHTLTHPRLSQIPLPLAREEVISSKKKLEDLFGVPVKHFAYPYGDYDDEVVSLVQEAGLTTACTTNPGSVRVGDDPFRLNRLTVQESGLINYTIFKVRKGLSNILRQGQRTVNALTASRWL